MRELSGLAAEWLAKEYGGRFDYSTTLASIGVVASQAAQNNPERGFILFVNCSVNIITLLPEVNPVAGSGIILAPSGGYTSFTLWDDLIMPALSYNAIASGAASSLLIIQCYRSSRTPKE